MTIANPIGTDGFDFLEFTTHDRKKLDSQFKSLGMSPIAKHSTHDVSIYQQNDIRFMINTTHDSMAKTFADLHGDCVCSMGFRVNDANAALKHALAHGAILYQPKQEKNIYGIPAIYGVGNSLIYFVDYKNSTPNYMRYFPELATTSNHPGLGLSYLDHVTHNLHRGQMDRWADFYTRIFNFREVRYFDISGKLTGLKSRAMTSPCNKIRIPLNESSDDKSQIEEFIKEFKGEGIQHVALGAKQIYKSVELLRKNGLEFLDTPDTYYELLEKRLPDHGEPIDDLKKYRILMDGTTKKEKKLLLQIFTKNMLGPVFFEIIQRKGDEGFGEGNFKALFESIELDQIRRGVLNIEDKKI